MFPWTLITGASVMDWWITAKNLAVGYLLNFVLGLARIFLLSFS